jgi:hypothetical protein
MWLKATNLVRRQTLDSALTQCCNNTTVRTKINDLGLCIAEVQSQDEIVFISRSVEITFRAYLEDVPNVEAIFLPVVLDLGLFFLIFI